MRKSMAQETILKACARICVCMKLKRRFAVFLVVLVEFLLILLINRSQLKKLYFIDKNMQKRLKNACKSL
jgi:hypothetical protein